MNKKPTPEERLNAASIRDQIGHSLRNYYQSCMAHELPPQLRAALKKLDDERPQSGEHVEVISEPKD